MNVNKTSLLKIFKSKETLNNLLFLLPRKTPLFHSFSVKNYSAVPERKDQKESEEPSELNKTIKENIEMYFPEQLNGFIDYTDRQTDSFSLVFNEILTLLKKNRFRDFEKTFSLNKELLMSNITPDHILMVSEQIYINHPALMEKIHDSLFLSSSIYEKLDPLFFHNVVLSLITLNNSTKAYFICVANILLGKNFHFNTLVSLVIKLNVELNEYESQVTQHHNLLLQLEQKDKDKEKKKSDNSDQSSKKKENEGTVTVNSPKSSSGGKQDISKSSLTQPLQPSQLNAINSNIKESKKKIRFLQMFIKRNFSNTDLNITNTLIDKTVSKIPSQKKSEEKKEEVVLSASSENDCNVQ